MALSTSTSVDILPTRSRGGHRIRASCIRARSMRYAGDNILIRTPQEQEAQGAVERKRERVSVYLLLLVVGDHDKGQDLLGGDAKRIHSRRWEQFGQMVGEQTGIRRQCLPPKKLFVKKKKKKMRRCGAPPLLLGCLLLSCRVVVFPWPPAPSLLVSHDTSTLATSLGHPCLQHSSSTAT